ncbi:uncharacterized protein FFB20_09602 [Fusarium fujikuroi]|nr:uncharacterized protein Y057_8669 [Fusarium fujikuroi]SCN66061.1 uncharacterized protein FFE2_00222 [Fusarium fujikuroi]SCN68948.1 uncharacterized protein FFC1_00217 [Fusarium fujikuroi]SCN94081.1 uncharacterized protein FFB20_09602 [Fusarium fujikuroi]SCO28247.1 uncharacterized protein FFNC_00220 [Fusarium fujikuroi]
MPTQAEIKKRLKALGFDSPAALIDQAEAILKTKRAAYEEAKKYDSPDEKQDDTMRRSDDLNRSFASVLAE